MKIKTLWLCDCPTNLRKRKNFTLHRRGFYCIIAFVSWRAPLAQLDRVAHYECEGLGFESLMARQESEDPLRRCIFNIWAGFSFYFFREDKGLIQPDFTWKTGRPLGHSSSYIFLYRWYNLIRSGKFRPHFRPHFLFFLRPVYSSVARCIITAASSLVMNDL